MNNPSVKYQNHFKLEVLFKDKLLFESELYENGIQYHLEKSTYTRYFLLDKDRLQIDDIIKRTGITVSTETIQMTDYSDVQKINKLYLYIALAVIVLFAVAVGVAKIW